MQIHINDDTLTVSNLFDDAIQEALVVRPKIWSQVEPAMRNEYPVCEQTLAQLKDLYCQCQIDMKRVMLVLKGGGNINGISVDAKPHEAYEDQNQMLNDIWENNKIIARSLLEKYGIEASYLSNPEDVARFNTERDVLRAEGKLLPGLNGL